MKNNLIFWKKALAICKNIAIMMHLWRRGRAVECTGLENRQGFIALREFESHRLRQIEKALIVSDWGFFYGC